MKKLPPHPITEERKAELEAELEAQKKRFLEASRRGASALKSDLSLMKWVKAYPRESAVFILLGGFVTARVLRARRKAS